MKLVRFSIPSVGGEARLINLAARRVGGGVEWPAEKRDEKRDDAIAKRKKTVVERNVRRGLIFAFHRRRRCP